MGPNVTSRRKHRYGRDAGGTSSINRPSLPASRPDLKRAIREKQRRQQELALSGRKSLSDRLKSLETDAAVVLKANLTARRRSDNKMNFLPLRSPSHQARNKNPPPVTSPASDVVTSPT